MMVLRMGLAAGCIAMGLGMPAGAAENAAEKPVTAELIADAAAVKPGSKVTLGVRFKIAPEWHIYWRNPGETGFATEVTWSAGGAPAAGVETQYPVPISFMSPGDLVSYGYEHEVLLLAEVAVPAEAKGEVKFEAKAKWLMCSNQCIPGKDTLTITLPVGEAIRANQAEFEKGKSLIPKTFEAGKYPQGVTASLATKPGVIEAAVTVDPSAGPVVGEDKQAAGLRRLYFFPYLADKKSGAVVAPSKIPAPDSSAGSVKVYTKPAAITAAAEAGDASKPLPASLRGVLVVQRVGADGKPGKPDFADVEVK